MLRRSAVSAKKKREPSPTSPPKKAPKKHSVHQATKKDPLKLEDFLCTAVGDRVLTCGDGGMGQLGHGPGGRERDKKPRAVAALDGRRFRQISAGALHTLVLTEDGEVLSWGVNDEGPLGRKSEDSEAEPRPVEFPVTVNIAMIAAGDTYSAALGKDGRVWLWGVFRSKQGDVGLSQEKTKVVKDSQVPKLLLVDSGRPLTGIVKLVGGENHLCLLNSKGELLTIGAAESGQLGRVCLRYSEKLGRSCNSRWLHPAPVPPPSDCIRFEDVWASGNGSYAVYSVKRQPEDVRHLVAFGLDNYDQLGVETEERALGEGQVRNYGVYFAQRAARLETVAQRWRQLTSRQHTLALTAEGKVYGCGRSADYRLGVASKEETRKKAVQVPLEAKVHLVAASDSGSFAVTQDGDAFAWGYNHDGELGLGLEEEEECKEPTRVQSKHLEDDGLRYQVLAISAGSQHTVFLAKKCTP